MLPHLLSSSEVKARIGKLPDILLKDVWDKIIPSEIGVKLPWFKDGIRWKDEFLWSPHCIWEALSTYWNQLTQIAQWEELEEYAKSKWFLSLKEFFMFMNMNSWEPWDKWQNWTPYLVEKSSSWVNTRLWFKQWVAGILASPEWGFDFKDMKMRASKKGLFKIRLQNKKIES